MGGVTSVKVSLMNTIRTIIILTFAAAASAGMIETVRAQSMWWVDGDRFCRSFQNQYTSTAMCGNVRRGEAVPPPTFRFEFQSPLGQDLTRLDAPPPPAIPPLRANAPTGARAESLGIQPTVNRR